MYFKSNILKHYSLKYFFSNLIIETVYCNTNNHHVMEKLNFQQPLLQSSMSQSFRNHSNMLICCKKKKANLFLSILKIVKLLNYYYFLFLFIYLFFVEAVIHFILGYCDDWKESSKETAIIYNINIL